MNFLNKNICKLFLIITLIIVPVISWAQETGNCTFQQFTTPGYTEIQCNNVGGTWSAGGTTQQTPTDIYRGNPVDPNVIYRGNSSDPCEGKICNPLGPDGVNSIPAFIQKLLEGLLRIGIPIIALAIIYSGFLFVKAQGKPEEISKAKSALLYTLIGSAILLGSWAIAQLISNTVLSL